MLAAQLPRGAQVYEVAGSDFALTREAAYLHGMEYQLRVGNWLTSRGSAMNRPEPTPLPHEEREQAEAEAAKAARKAANTSDAMLRAQLARLRERQAAQTDDDPKE